MPEDYLKIEKTVFGEIFLIANKLQAVGDQFLGSSDMTTKQWFLTAILSQFQGNPPSISEVAGLMGSSRQNVKQLALKLEEKDFLKIEKDKKDARTLRLKLSEKSHEYWDTRKDQDDRFIRELFGGISNEELRSMASGFDKLSIKLEELGRRYGRPEAEE